MEENKINQENKNEIRGEGRKILNRIILWAGAAAFIIGSVWGILKIAGNLAPEESVEIDFAVLNSDWVKGDRNARAVLMEYSDFECPACAVYASTLDKITEEFGDKIALVYRHFPLKENHKTAEIAARAAEAAGRQGKFWEMHDLIFKNQNEWAEKADAKDFFIKYAQALNLDIDQFKKDAEAREVKDKVEKDYQSGLSYGANYTPTIFLNGKKITPQNYEDFRKIINQALQ